MYLERAKLEEFEEYYQIKCESFVAFWSQGNYGTPPRERLYRFYTDCLQNDGKEKHKEVYLIKTDAGEIAGYLYLEDCDGRVNIPIAVRERFTKRGLAKQAIYEGLRIARAKGYTQSEIEIRQDNTASMKLYTACGYRRGEKTRALYCAALGRTVDLYAYRRKIEDTAAGCASDKTCAAAGCAAQDGEAG